MTPERLQELKGSDVCWIKECVEEIERLMRELKEAQWLLRREVDESHERTKDYEAEINLRALSIRNKERELATFHQTSNRWRAGTKIKRNLYCEDQPIAMLADEDTAASIAEKMNYAETVWRELADTRAELAAVNKAHVEEVTRALDLEAELARLKGGAR